MEFLIDGKKVRLNPYNMRYSPLIGEGTKARVYLIGEKAYKLYKPFCDTELMTKETIDYLKEIPTKRVILPKSPILDKKRRLKGYISKYIVDFGISLYLKHNGRNINYKYINFVEKSDKNYNEIYEKIENKVNEFFGINNTLILLFK